MLRIRFHGRGGQGMKTASRILGTAFFLEGYEVQDAPRYGAERRGAPIFAYVRADKEKIYERGIIVNPDLIVVADETLFDIPNSGILESILPETTLLIHTNKSIEYWNNKIAFEGQVITLAKTINTERESMQHLFGVYCSGAGAGISNLISIENLKKAIEEELSTLSNEIKTLNIDLAIEAFQKTKKFKLTETHSKTLDFEKPSEWYNIQLDQALEATPAILNSGTSTKIKTGLWRTEDPVINYEFCKQCWWLCTSFCPDGVMKVNNDQFPEIDYEHCKGCMICLAQCPHHAIYKMKVQNMEGKEGM